MVDEVDLSDEEQRVLDAIAALEAQGEATTPEVIARRAGLELDAVRSSLSRLLGEADLVRELDPDAEVVGPRYAVKDSASPR